MGINLDIFFKSQNDIESNKKKETIKKIDEYLIPEKLDIAFNSLIKKMNNSIYLDTLCQQYNIINKRKREFIFAKMVFLNIEEISKFNIVDIFECLKKYEILYPNYIASLDYILNIFEEHELYEKCGIISKLISNSVDYQKTLKEFDKILFPKNNKYLDILKDFKE